MEWRSLYDINCSRVWVLRMYERTVCIHSERESLSTVSIADRQSVYVGLHTEIQAGYSPPPPPPPPPQLQFPVSKVHFSLALRHHNARLHGDYSLFRLFN